MRKLYEAVSSRVIDFINPFVDDKIKGLSFNKNKTELETLQQILRPYVFLQDVPLTQVTD